MVFGLTAAVASLSFLPLWETGNVCLPDTIAQMGGQKKVADYALKYVILFVIHIYISSGITKDNLYSETPLCHTSIVTRILGVLL